jgi:hypothetical protein
MMEKPAIPAKRRSDTPDDPLALCRRHNRRKQMTKKAKATPSVRAYLAAAVKKSGKIPTASVRAYIQRTGRSTVTMYRQAAELGLKIKDGSFVRA